MATRHRNGSTLLHRYTDMNALVAISGVFVGVASMLLWEFFTISMVIVEWTPTVEHYLIITAAGAVAAFATSKTRAVEHYEPAELGLVVGGAALTVLSQYWTWLEDLMYSEPALQVIGFLVTMGAWLVIAR